MITLTLSTACLVGLRSVQQLNVIHHLYLPAAVTSFCIAAAEVSVIIGIVGAGMAETRHPAGEGSDACGSPDRWKIEG